MEVLRRSEIGEGTTAGDPKKKEFLSYNAAIITGVIDNVKMADTGAAEAAVKEAVEKAVKEAVEATLKMEALKMVAVTKAMEVPIIKQAIYGPIDNAESEKKEKAATYRTTRAAKDNMRMLTEEDMVKDVMIKTITKVIENAYKKLVTPTEGGRKSRKSRKGKKSRKNKRTTKRR